MRWKWISNKHEKAELAICICKYIRTYKVVDNPHYGPVASENGTELLRYEYLILGNSTKIARYINQRFEIIFVHLYLAKHCEIESNDSFEIVVYFQTLSVFFANQCIAEWDNSIVFPQVPFSKQFQNVFSAIWWFPCEI